MCKLFYKLIKSLYFNAYILLVKIWRFPLSIYQKIYK